VAALAAPMPVLVAAVAGDALVVAMLFHLAFLSERRCPSSGGTGAPRASSCVSECPYASILFAFVPGAG
jgi:hypothetical protein